MSINLYFLAVKFCHSSILLFIFLNLTNGILGASILKMINLILGGNENFKTALQSHWTKR